MIFSFSYFIILFTITYNKYFIEFFFSFLKDDNESFQILEVYSDDVEQSKPNVLKLSKNIVKELSDLRKEISNHDRLNSDLLHQLNILQSKSIQYFESCAQRERKNLELKETDGEQQIEICKQLKIQNSLLQKMIERLNRYI